MPRCPSPPFRTNTRCCGADRKRRSSRSARNSASASCPWSPLGVGFLTGAIDARTRFAEGDIRGIESRFSPENLPHNLALVDAAEELGRTQAGHARADRAGLADGAEALDRAHPRARRRWRTCSRTSARPQCGSRRPKLAELNRAVVGDRDPGRASPGRGAGLLGRGGASEDLIHPRR